jgi:alanyl-tRNA synthetase
VTERLYYNDSFLRAFDAQVISCEPEGERWRVILDRTAFYPTSGGQPHDLGTLAGAPVIEVADAEEKIVHYTSAAVEVGPVHAEIDWPRRIDHMQQHTGQHLLSAAFIELFNFPTISFHLGREVCTIDLTAPAIAPRHIEQAERRSNEIIFEDRVVTVRYGTAQELEEAGVRKRVDREGILRAIEVEGFDRQPCGGTHLARTGQAGLLLTRKLERRRDFWRLEFVCGFRALAVARADYVNLTRDAALLSCGIPEVPRVLEKLVEERRAQHSAVKRLEEHLAEHEARSLLAANPAATPDAPRLIASAIEDASAEYLRLLAAKLASEARVVALLASRSTAHVVFAQSRHLAADMGALLREALKEFPGKGGGGKDFAQASLSEPAQADAFLARARREFGIREGP